MEREILTAHRLTARDTSPLQFISAQLLEHYRRCEAELAAINAAGAPNEHGRANIPAKALFSSDHGQTPETAVDAPS